MLISMIHEKKLDPWDIDLSILTREFLKKIQEMQAEGLAIGGNMVLASSILLKYKSESIIIVEKSEEEQLSPEPTFIHVPDLSFSIRIPPKKPITLPELISEMERVIGHAAKPKRKIIEAQPLQLPEIKFDVEGEVNFVLERLKRERQIAFFSLIEKNDERERIIRLLFAVLLLFKEGKVKIRQNEIFDEVMIYAD